MPTDSTFSKLMGTWVYVSGSPDSGFILQPEQKVERNGIWYGEQASLMIGFSADSILFFEYLNVPKDSYYICGMNFDYFDAEYLITADTLYISDKHTYVPTFFLGDYICKFVSDSLLYVKKFRDKPSEYSLFLNKMLFFSPDSMDIKDRESVQDIDTITLDWKVEGDSLLICSWAEYQVAAISLSPDRTGSLIQVGKYYEYDLSEMAELPQFAECKEFIVGKPREIYESYYNFIFEYTLTTCASAKDLVFYILIPTPW